MSKLTDYKVLSFDVYGTLIDWETGLLQAMAPLLSTASSTSRKPSKAELLEIYHSLEAKQQSETPDMVYSQLLTTIHPKLASKLELPPPTAEQSQQFGESIGTWPAFSDTVEALKTLSKTYKLVVLSNVDRQSFQATNTGPLAGVNFDLILTAQDIGSYKPNPRNFEHMLSQVRQKFGFGKDKVLTTAQSQFHDHHPSKKLAIKSVWIVRPGGIMGNRSDQVYDWRFDTLGDMASEVEQEG